MLLSTSEGGLQNDQEDFLNDIGNTEDESENGKNDENKEKQSEISREEEIMKGINENLENKKAIHFESDDNDKKVDKNIKIVSAKIFKILSEFNFTQNIEKSIIKLEKIKETFPQNGKVVLTLSRMFQKKNENEKACKILEEIVLKEYDKSKIENLSPSIRSTQYDIYYNLGLLKKNMYTKNKDMKYLEEAMTCFQQCNLFCPNKKGGLVLLASIYDNLKIFVNSHKIWEDLIETNPHEDLFIDRFTLSLKESQQKEKLLKFLRDMNALKSRCSKVYFELSKLEKKKKMRKEASRKYDFYSYIPKICSKLLFNEYSYSILQKIKSRGKKTISVLENLIKSGSDSSSEWIVAILYNLAQFSKDETKDVDKEIMDTLLNELENRMVEKNLMKFLSLFLTTFHPRVTKRLIFIFVKNKKLLKKNDIIYKMFFEQLIRFYLKKNEEINVGKAFLHLRDGRITPYLINTIKYGEPSIQKKAALIVHGFLKEKKSEIEEALMIEFGKKKLNEDVKMYFGVALYKIRKEKSYLRVIKKKLKVKNPEPLENDIVEFVNNCDGVEDLKKLLKSIKRKKGKESCKTQ